VIVLHDNAVDATTEGTGLVAALAAEQLRALDAGSWFAEPYAGARVPLWHEVLALLARHPAVGLLAELKGDWDAASAALATGPLLAAGLADRTVAQSFSRSTVAALREVAPDLRRGLLVEEAADDLLDACAALDVVTCNPSGQMLVDDPGLVATLHAAGRAVMVWTLDEDRMWDEALALGVDAIITDRPDRLAGWLSGRASAPQGFQV
jgi:glycerophosphoryl diester phosphodiesterase